jgi:G8 domain
VIDFFGKYGATFAADGTGPLYFSNQSLESTPSTNWVSGMNQLDALNKELNFVINGKTTSSKTLEAQSVKCRANEASWCITAPTATECTGSPMPWSELNSWVTAENPYPDLPKDGDSVTIPAGRIIMFDLAESPKLKLLTIVGCLEFSNTNTKDQKLHAEHIFVFGGKLTIGTTLIPYTRKAEIILYGDYDGQFLTLPGAVEMGNKMIANVGQVKMVGK